MQWIHQFQLFLFDFDGLLVNTEEIHYLSYQRMCQAYGFILDWSFERYCQAAHYRAEALKEQIYERFPELYAKEPVWATLYAKKKQAVLDLLNEGAVHLMPGTEKILKALQEANIKRCVVTHSPLELIETVVRKNPILKTIPYWITRTDYVHPKPDPECYLKAIEKFALPEDNIIGFEDSPRGLQALMGTRAKPILISQVNYPEIASFEAKGVLHYSTFDSIPDNAIG